MWHKSVSTKADAYLAEAKKHNGEVGAHALHFDYNSAAEFCAAAMTDGGYQHVLITPLDRRNEIPARPVADEITDGQAEHAYWQFDARRKGYAEWRGAPQSERDAFKAEYCSALAMCATNATIPVQVPAAEVRAQALGDAIEEVAKVGALWIDNSNRDTAAPILSQAIAAIRSLAQQSPADKACEVRAADLEREIAQLKERLEKKHKSHFFTSQALHNVIVGNQSAWIEWQHGAGAEAAMTWIHNSLVGPGLIPDGKEAQPWFNANVDDRYEIPPMKDGAMKTATNEGERDADQA